jgi:hypothetical protein
MALQLQKPPSSKSSRRTLDLTDADRPLSVDEEEAENNAQKFSIKHYRRIVPTAGTLGFLFRNFSGGNFAVIEVIRDKIEHSQGINKKLRDLLTLWNFADEFSRNRIDIFDHFCQKLNLERSKLWGFFQECLYEYQNLLVKMAISDMTLDLVENVDKFSRAEKNVRDRELAARITKVDKVEPLVAINDNSTTVNNNLSIKDSNIGFSFSEMIKSGDKVIRGEEDKRDEMDLITEEQRLLEEGNQEFIDGEIINENEKERIER